MKIKNLTQGTTLADKVVMADNIFTRMKGLLGRKSFLKGEALIIKPGNSIHMFFMRFSIDAIFLNRQNKVVGLVKNLKPFQFSPIFFKAFFVIELPYHTIEETHTQMGDYLSLEPLN